jgi:hypothetical protein
MKTSEIEMVPNTQTSIGLDELNRLIAEQRGVSIDELAIQAAEPRKRDLGEPARAEANPMDTNDTVVTTEEQALSDEELAAQYRSQADALFKEAKALREQAEQLVPTKRKAKTKTEESA